MTRTAYLGIDIGTSGIRGSCIDDHGEEITTHRIRFKVPAAEDGVSEQDPMQWREQLQQLLAAITEKLRTTYAHQDTQIIAISIDGTSSTLIACDDDGTPLSPALMYNDQQARPQADRIAGIAPADSAVHGASSSLAKALLLLERYPGTRRLCHQADWLSAWLSGDYSLSDENNCLKLGYDSRRGEWPAWISDLPGLDKALLPNVVAPGTPIGPVLAQHSAQYALSEDCIVVAGTTDSNAAVLAALGINSVGASSLEAGGAAQSGDAVTSLGSTLVLKLFTSEPIFAPEYGIYSHHLNGRWLVGGASNTGGAVLLQQFSSAQLDAMDPQLQPEQDTGLDYYPLPGRGERFPVCDADKPSKISPRPDDDVTFYQGMLEGIARIEADAYDKLVELGADRPKRIITAGGGSRNEAWSRIRERYTGIPVVTAQHSEASYGSALLARQGYKTMTS